VQGRPTEKTDLVLGACGTLNCDLDSDGILDSNDFVAAIQIMNDGTVMYCEDECGGMRKWMST